MYIPITKNSEGAFQSKSVVLPKLSVYTTCVYLNFLQNRRASFRVPHTKLEFFRGSALTSPLFQMSKSKLNTYVFIYS